ncbi:MAG: threonine dehydratase [Betaproteobacteria bacterium]|nr:MAG: threonine dehydratase [Betaproteobacteria bacterium]
MFSVAELEAAARIVYAAMPPTPQYAWPLLGERAGCEVWVKHENHTPIGAFKLRGGLVYFERNRPAKGVISATRGNHGQSIAFAGRRAGVPVTIVVPHGNSREKNAAMRGFGAQLIEFGGDFDEARVEAERVARERDLGWVPSFHPDLVLGVATYALELLRAVPDLDTVYAPIGMGSGICGLIRTRDLLGLATRIVGVQAERAPAYARSFAAGRVITTQTADTLADGMATRVPDPGALEIIRGGAERIVTLSEEEIAAAMRILFTDTHNLAEGAGAAPLAALLKERAAMRGRKSAVILSGGNVDLDLLLRVLG